MLVVRYNGRVALCKNVLMSRRPSGESNAFPLVSLVRKFVYAVCLSGEKCAGEVPAGPCTQAPVTRVREKKKFQRDRLAVPHPFFRKAPWGSLSIRL